MTGDETESLADPAALHYNITAYNQEINRELRQAFRTMPLRVGDRAPSIRAVTVEGETFDLDAERAQAHVALVFGCASAPPCVAELPAIEAVSRSLDPAAGKIVFVYTREIHPGARLAGGRVLGPHSSLEMKLDQARELRDELGLSMTICADDLTGTAHQQYGGLPFFTAVVHRDGTLVHRSEWATAGEIGDVLANLSLWDDAARTSPRMRISYSETLRYAGS
jgi:hypothetical protein